MNAVASQLGDFFDWMYLNETGYVYVALKDRQTNAWSQDFFEWPTQRNAIIEHCLVNRDKVEVYYAPALYTTDSATKADVKGSRVFWVEFDGETPQNLNGLPNPSLRVMSSQEGHEHWYWRVDELVGWEEIEHVNRAMTYMFGADASGWDSSQVLRPINTFNHKRQREVTVVEWHHDLTLPVGLFKGLPEPPPLVDLESFGEIPDVQDVVFKYNWTKQARDLFAQGQPMGQRSSGLMQLGYFCAEMNMTNEEMVALLLNADERWGKFKDRRDRMQRLGEIVTIARQKHPFKNEGSQSETPKLQPMGLLTLLRTEIKLEWVWDGMLQKAGYMLLTGHSGVGKTQTALGASMHFALGKKYLDREVNSDGLKIGFLSLEMGLADIKEFLMTMVGRYTEEEQRWMEETLQFFPLGEPLYINREAEKKMIEEIVGDLKLDGVVIDSLGSTTEGELTNESDVKNVMDWNDRFRQRFGAFTWYIHHHRKAQSENKKPNKLADVFGSQYLTARATTVAALWETQIENQLEFIPLKLRLAKKPSKFLVERDGYLHMTRKVGMIGGKTPIEVQWDIAEEQGLTEEPGEEPSERQQTPEKPEGPSAGFEL
jgi:hypothetical protein